jgi:folate-binding Fe-S cluster repair protein YgfZ
VLAGSREVGRAGTVVRHHELGVVALALVKQSVLGRAGESAAALTVAGAAAAVDPDDAPEALDAQRAAARERVQQVRSGTIAR